jgi:hypothetical protein
VPAQNGKGVFVSVHLANFAFVQYAAQCSNGVTSIFAEDKEHHHQTS